MSGWQDAQARHAARQRIAAAEPALRTLRREMESHMREARSFTSADLSYEAKQRQMYAENVRKHYEPQLAQLRIQIRDDAEFLRSQVASMMPKLADDASSLMRAQMRWDAVRTRLAEGIPLRSILTTADQETVLAIREWAPSWLAVAAAPSRSDLGAAMMGQPPAQHDAAATHQLIDNRLAELVGGDLAEAVAGRREAEIVEAITTPAVQHAEAVLAGDPSATAASGGLAAAVASALASQAARGDNEPADNNTGDAA